MEGKAEELFLKDCYLKECEAEVLEVNQGKFVVLGKTIFYPQSGGQPFDTGRMKRESDGQEFKVVFAGKFGGNVSHEVSPEGLKVRDKVMCKIDWDRRYLFMRYHTASHVLSEVLNKETGALITGNQISEDKTRIDFSLDEFDKEKIMSFEEKANEIIERGLPVTLQFLPREEAEQIPKLTKLAKGLSPEIKEIRVVNIEGFDQSACAGTHVKNTSEIGKIKIVDLVNKGKNNRRVYFVLE